MGRQRNCTQTTRRRSAYIYNLFGIVLRVSAKPPQRPRFVSIFSTNANALIATCCHNTFQCQIEIKSTIATSERHRRPAYPTPDPSETIFRHLCAP